MFIISKASSSRLPLPTTRIICSTCRSFNSTPANQVKRPQKPYEAPVAKIDSYGNRIPIDEYMENDKAEINRRKFLEGLTEHKSRSNLEKYGGSARFGLRGSASRSSDDHEYEQAGDEDWRNKVGIKYDTGYNHRQPQNVQIRLGRKKFERANQSYLEEAKRLNPASYSKDHGYGRGSGNERSGWKDARDRQAGSGSGKSFGLRRDQESKSTLTLPLDDGHSRQRQERNNILIKAPKKSFGLSALSQSKPRSREAGSSERDHNPSLIRPAPSELNTRSAIATKAEGEAEMVLATDTKSPKTPSERWAPTKKLTYSAMAGLKTLHSMDPDKFSREVLSKKFGISREAVTRILKSKYRDSKKSSDIEGNQVIPEGEGSSNLKGTKWDRDPGSSEVVSPVPAILRAYGR
ncbi:uncharacterized protein I303_100246 [Kwoniella dejecticola CBS 10117]|uniref:Required for respiratory growth protein 9, mitochondrial n=1 Tax=Kwoniella dejecticola CBS 10117 TaxID=1296121 RepID=A0A1A6AEC8_9TREE|nr:uncharacterized protein I303_00248 [Kwoniella dejecticola CBS 10117]OBR88431.1 hypothetical protein I303_00248 [Kwoniella dejecticola CBS 10117]